MRPGIHWIGGGRGGQYGGRSYHCAFYYRTSSLCSQTITVTLTPSITVHPCRGAVPPSLAVEEPSHRPLPLRRTVHCCHAVPSITVQSIAVKLSSCHPLPLSPSPLSRHHTVHCCPLPSIAIESPLRVHCCPCHQAVNPQGCKGKRKHDERDTFLGGWIE